MGIFELSAFRCSHLMWSVLIPDGISLVLCNVNRPTSSSPRNRGRAGCCHDAYQLFLSQRSCTRTPHTTPPGAEPHCAAQRHMGAGGGSRGRRHERRHGRRRRRRRGHRRARPLITPPEPLSQFNSCAKTALGYCGGYCAMAVISEPWGTHHDPKNVLIDF